jgi:AraC family transcriptional regulator
VNSDHLFGFYGELVRHRSAGPFVITESAFRARATLPMHSHARPYFTFTLRGTYREKYGTAWRICTAGATVVHPANEVHAQEFASEPALLLRMALAHDDDEFPMKVAFERPACLESLSVARAVRRMHRELGDADDSSEMILEGLGYELVGHSLLRAATTGGSKKRALCARMFLHSSSRRPVTLAAMSTVIGVSRATLYRDFKSVFGYSPGAYLRAVRLESATKMLDKTTLPISVIAAECGFYDQSHLDRCFRRRLGFSPSTYRHLKRMS